MKVLKFGGTSVANAERIINVANIVKATLNENCKKVGVVVSALGGLTDHLINTAKMAEAGNDNYRDGIDDIYYRHRKVAETLFTPDELKDIRPYLKEKTKNLESLLKGVSLIKELSPRVQDTVMSYGELMSSFLIANYLKKTLPDVDFIDSRNIINTNSDFSEAKVNFKQTYQNIQSHLSKDEGVYVMGGFIAANNNGVTTTLGRGGSDYSAAIYAAGLNAQEIEIWTDVDGVMTTDPRKVKKAFSLKTMTYEEAMEMSHFGAKVIHPPTVQPALDKQIPIRIRNTFNTSFPGTLISNVTDVHTDMSVKGISTMSDISLVSVQGSGLIGVTGIAGRLFNALALAKVNIILITQASSEHSICFAVKPAQSELAKQAIENEFAYEIRSHLIGTISIENDLAVVALIGSNMKNTIGVSGQMFNALGQNGVNIRAIAQGSSELNISAVISKVDVVKSLNALHDAFFLSELQTVHLFIVGTGLISRTLIKQIAYQQAYLRKKLLLEVKLVAITNTRQMLFNTSGIDLDNWKDSLAKNGESANLTHFVEQMNKFNLSNSIFVDCTASAKPIAFYEYVLNASISIVTPNKIANSSSYKQYADYRTLAKKRGVQFLYETNVGAGLPIISTMNDLISSGDEILEIEAVLSGSLSFIFNTFNQENSFSSVVQAAKEKGFTEPDPREDLSGKDVARKVLILAREMGQTLEMQAIDVENILPESCINATTVDTFFEALKANDDKFEALQQKAAKKGQKLRMLATIAADKASVGLKAVDADNPFYGLSGSDNMIVFTTMRYKERPLVVKGPGAGAEVTAAGVFAEIISVGNKLK